MGVAHYLTNFVVPPHFLIRSTTTAAVVECLNVRYVANKTVIALLTVY